MDPLTATLALTAAAKGGGILAGLAGLGKGAAIAGAGAAGLGLQGGVSKWGGLGKAAGLMGAGALGGTLLGRSMSGNTQSPNFTGGTTINQAPLQIPLIPNAYGPVMPQGPGLSQLYNPNLMQNPYMGFDFPNLGMAMPRGRQNPSTMWE